MLCVVHEGISYPLMWTMLNKQKGNSISAERMDLLDRFKAVFPDLALVLTRSRSPERLMMIF